jgi:aerobic carbon-monoxide dehydrogenase small subunit
MTHDSLRISRRDFLKDAGLFMGGTALGISGTFLKQPEENKAPAVFICPFCAQGFVSFNDLNTHVTKNHTGSEQTILYACPYCQERFPSLESLQTHTGTEGLITFKVNGHDFSLPVKANWTLVFVLREKLGLTGTKIGCEQGSCGTCTVLVDGRAMLACLVLAIELNGREISTIEGMAVGGMLSPLQQAFVEGSAAQCGYCTPGFIMTARHLLEKNPHPTRDEVREALAGNLCICGNTKNVVETVLVFGNRDK